MEEVMDVRNPITIIIPQDPGDTHLEQGNMKIFSRWLFYEYIFFRGAPADFRPVIHYRDLDAPREPEEFI